jgi:branched-chain amino acid transport system ATP-binding protein
VLEVLDVVCRYGNITAIRGATLVVRAGELIALVGPNGAGKTTLLRTVSGLRRVSSGTMRFEGSDITSASARTILSLGIAHCPEGRRVFSELTVVENLRMGSYLRRDAVEVAEDLDRIFDEFPRLAERRQQMAGTLSGGEQQMLAIGRALMSRPKLVMFDEPSLGLAPNVVEQTFRFIRRLCAAGTTVLMVEQNAYAALEMCDRAYVLESGSLVVSGNGCDLLRDPHVRAAYLGG